MNAHAPSILVLALLLGACGTQPRAPSDLADRLRDPDPTVRTSAITEAAACGVAGIAAADPLLISDDVEVRLAATRALWGIARHCTRPGAEAERAAVSAALLALLRERGKFPAPTRHELVRLLGLTANDARTVQELSAWLADPELGGIVLFALERIPHAEVDRVLVSHLTRPGPIPVAGYATALGSRRSQAAVGVLLELAAAGVEPAACYAALARIADPRAEDALRGWFASGTAAAADDWLRYLENRSAAAPEQVRRELDAVRAYALSPEARVAALVALQQRAFSGFYDLLVEALDDESELVRRTARGMLVGWSAASLGKDLLASRARVTPRVQAEILRVLTERGDPAVLPLVKEAATAEDATLRHVGLELLGRFDDPGLEAILLEAGTSEDETDRNVAAISLIEHARRHIASGKADAALPLLHRVLEKCDAEAELRSAIQLTARAAAPASVPYLERHANDDVYAEDVFRAHAAIAPKLTDKAEAQAMLEKVYRLSDERATRNDALRGLLRLGVSATGLAAKAGVIAEWRILGPCAGAEDKDLATHPFGSAGPDLARRYPGAATEVAWQTVTSRDCDGIVDLRKLLRPCDDVCAYAVHDLDWPQDAKLMLKLGSDDSVAVWVNGELVHRLSALRGVIPDEDRVPVTFRKGKNRLLVKVANGSGEWGFCVRIADPAGKPVDLSAVARR